jgi:PAS domain S-box-containing protein
MVAGLSELGPDAARVLAIAVKAADLGIWQWDIRANTFEYSERAKRIFGFPPGLPVERQQIIDVLHPGDHAVAKEQATRSLDPKLSKREPYLYRIHRANDGALRWIRAFGEPVFQTHEGEQVAVRFIGTLEDVTDEVEARDRLAREEARLRMAIEASGIAVWELDLADGSVAHSPELNRMCGFPADARPTLAEFRSRYAPGERERIEREGAEVRARGGTSFESEIRHIWPDGTEKWLAMKAQVAPGEPGNNGRVIGVVVDITEHKQREEQLALLVSEFKHRIKNSFALTQALLGQALREEGVSEATRDKLFARLRAMAGTHDVLAGAEWTGATLQAVLEGAVRPFVGQHDERIVISGPEVRLSPRGALSFSLVFHELLTNATKYGALSEASGQVRVEVTPLEGLDELAFSWREMGGPPVVQSEKAGFGTKLIERLLAGEYAARLSRDLRPEGLTLKVEFPAGSIVAPPP